MVSEFRAPTENRLGLMRGTYAITLALYEPDGTATGETIDASAQFYLLSYRCVALPRGVRSPFVAVAENERIGCCK